MEMDSPTKLLEAALVLVSTRTGVEEKLLF